MGFIDSIRRWRLVQQGMSSGRKRRTQEQNTLFDILGRSVLIRLAMYAGFLIALVALAWRAPDVVVWGKLHSLAVVSVLAVCAVLIFQLNHNYCRRKNGHVALMFGGVVFQIWFVKLVQNLGTGEVLPREFHFLVIPFALIPMVHSVLLGSRAGVYSVVFGSLFGALMIPVADRWVFLGMSLFCGLVAVIATAKVRRRSKLLRAGFWVGVAALVLDLLFGKITTAGLADWNPQSWKYFGQACALAVGTGVFTGLIVSGILPALEGIFGLTTGVSWLELGDLHHPLLRQMNMEAPGTFHHSLIVAALAESAAEAIGADALACRASAYFHDIGKLSKPEYFIENQNGENPHDQLTPSMSALIIIAHVKDGIDLAIKHKLNPFILQVIQEHHGNSLVYYFYRKAQEKKAQELAKQKESGEAADDALPEVATKNFRYPGPTPQSKESGIISLADAVESASRAIKKPSPSRVTALIDDIVFNRIKEGQLDQSGLTLNELALIRKSFAQTLRSTMHQRIQYPKEATETQEPAEEAKRADEVPTVPQKGKSTEKVSEDVSEPAARLSPKLKPRNAT